MMKKIIQTLQFNRLFLMLITVLFIYSCNDETELRSDEYFEGMGDFYIQKIKVGEEVLYAPYYGVYSNISMHSANVETPDGEMVELKPFEYLNTYIFEPDATDFSTTMPVSGNYRFSGTYGENESFEIIDVFNSGFIEFPKIDSFGYDTTNKNIFLFWENGSGVNMYKVRLLNQNGTIVFNGVELTPNSNVFGITANTEGWISAPYKGDVLTLQLNAYSFDGNATENNWIYNIECNAVTETQVIWGE